MSDRVEWIYQMNTIKATHIREDGTKVAYKAIRVEIGKFELEYTIQRFLQNGWKITKSGVLHVMEKSILFSGNGAFYNLIHCEEITQEAVDLCKKLFPTFY